MKREEEEVSGREDNLEKKEFVDLKVILPPPGETAQLHRRRRPTANGRVYQKMAHKLVELNVGRTAKQICEKAWSIVSQT